MIAFGFGFILGGFTVLFVLGLLSLREKPVEPMEKQRFDWEPATNSENRQRLTTPSTVAGSNSLYLQ